MKTTVISGHRYRMAFARTLLMYIVIVAVSLSIGYYSATRSLFSVIIVLTVTALFGAIAFRPLLGITVLTCAQAWVPKTNFGSIPLADILFLIVVFVTIGMALVRKRRAERRTLIFVLLNLIYSAVECLLGITHVGVSPAVTVAFRQFPFILMLLLINLEVKSEGDIYRIERGVVISALPVALIADLQFLFPHSFAPWYQTVLNKYLHYPTQVDYLRYDVVAGHLFLRATSTMLDPNILGGFLLVAYVFAITTYLRSTAWWKNIVFAPAIVLFVSGAIFTLSRGAWIALVITTLFYFIHRKAVKSALSSLIAFMVGLVLLRDRMTQSQSIDIRSTLLHDSLQAWIHSPLWGFGTGSLLVPVRYGDFYFSGGASTFLQILTDGGVIGLFLYVLIPGSLAVGLFKFRRQRHASGYLALLYGIIISGFSDTYYYTAPNLAYLYYLVLGLGFALLKIKTLNSSVYEESV